MSEQSKATRGYGKNYASDTEFVNALRNLVANTCCVAVYKPDSLDAFWPALGVFVRDAITARDETVLLNEQGERQ